MLHNTAVPSLEDRPNGFSAANMEELRHYYAEVRGWHGGPHLFVDQTGIWVFNPLDRPGVHSPSWNRTSWGVEMLGDYETEPFDSGEGLLVRENAVAALGALFRRLGVPPDDARFKLHREDPKTTHLCPGKNVHKEEVRREIVALRATVAAHRKDGSSVVLDAILQGGTLFADARALGKATGIATNVLGAVPVRAFVGDRFRVSWNAAIGRADLMEV